MLFLDNAAPDSCCAERPLHIPTYPRLVSTAATVREKTWEQIHRQTGRPADKPTDYNNPSLRMRARVNYSLAYFIIVSQASPIFPHAHETRYSNDRSCQMHSLSRCNNIIIETQNILGEHAPRSPTQQML